MRDLRWLAVPVAAYLVITLVLPAANTAASRRDLGPLAHHALWVVLGCAIVLAGIALASALITRWQARANNRPTPRVPPRGQP